MAHRETFTEDYDFEVTKTRKGAYSVNLPHQCDSWEIIGADDNDSVVPNDNGYPALPTHHEFAVKQMTLFVMRAQEALEKLKKL